MPVTGADPVLMAGKAAIFPVPLAARPIEGLLFDQEYIVVPPVLVEEKETGEVFSPLQTT